MKRAVRCKYKLWVSRRNALKAIAQRGYHVTAAIKGAKVFQAHKSAGRFLIKKVTEKALLAHQDILPAISDVHRHLVIPSLEEVFRDPQNGAWVVLKWIDGKSLSKSWDPMNVTTEGGRAISPRMIKPWLDALESLFQIDTDALPATRSQFIQSSEHNIELIRKIETKFIREGWLTQAELREAERLLISVPERTSGRSYTITNGDFQYRNFVQMADGKFAVIDWDGLRISRFEAERAVSYQWLLMWKNQDWRREFMYVACRKFTLDPGIFQATMVSRSLKLAWMWRRDKNLRDLQVRHLRMALSEGECARILQH